MQLHNKTLGLLLLLVALASVDAGALRRQLRDVSHLPLEYLPPVVLPPLPSREYLPPVEQHAATLSHVLQPPRDYLPPSNEYLPPVEEVETTTEEIVPSTTAEAVEAPATTTTTEQPTEQPTTEAAVEVEPEVAATEETVEVKTHEDIEQGSGVLQADGYHYSAPEVIPDLGQAVAAVEAYLPPLEDNAVMAEELPESDESAALLDDGYHYRSIRRLRL
ncbi:uncharacterized protein LOC132791325 [Drosophila nasuta]|uniref:uncharacterized protein LOC132791325 n=1 Tax=Drosophila nasuta TaxID=42062 RepID=UPI00295E2A69|nr:uncharacterized protein LOC132791325 [Drosophila nasuta]